MFTRKRIGISSRCYGCDNILTSNEIDLSEIFDGLCETCYNEAMKIAYEDLEDL